MAINITLATKAGYPVTYISSVENIKVEGWDAFISIDSKGERYGNGVMPSGKPEITLTGVTVSAHYVRKVEHNLVIGDVVTIGDTDYTLVSKKTRYFGNGDIKLVPVQQ